MRSVLKDLGNAPSYGSVYRTLRYDLKFFRYTVPMMQHLKESDIAMRFEFAQWMTNNIDIADTVWFTDESHFYLNSPINKRNCRVWGKEKPQYWNEKPLHDDKVTVWAALSSAGVIGRFFFETDGEVKTVNSDRYLHLLRNKFIPALRRRGIHPADIYFQQDGATPHTSGQVLGWLQKTFGRKLISFRTDCVWPPHFPDLSPLDFFLWGYLKDKVYAPKPNTLEDLKLAIHREIRNVTSDICRNVINNFKKRLELVIEQK